MIGTNNQANQAARNAQPDDDDPPYANIACDVAVQTVRPKTLEVVMNLEVGQEEGNRMSLHWLRITCQRRNGEELIS
jgi:ATP-dependent DNA helicase 2 subunit 2